MLLLSLLFCPYSIAADTGEKILLTDTIASAFWKHLGRTCFGNSIFCCSAGCFIQFVGRRLLTLKTFMQGVIKGVQAMIPANMILVLAWAISGICRDLLETQVFIGSLVQNDAGLAGNLMPAIIFAIASFLSFSTGTAWGNIRYLNSYRRYRCSSYRSVRRTDHYCLICHLGRLGIRRSLLTDIRHHNSVKRRLRLRTYRARFHPIAVCLYYRNFRIYRLRNCRSYLISAFEPRQCYCRHGDISYLPALAQLKA